VHLGHAEDGPWVQLRTVTTRPQDPPAPPTPAPGRELGTVTFVHEVRRDVVHIGRDDDNDVVVHDLLVSRHHAELRRGAGGALTIVDLHSHNGTFVNGRKVDQSTLREDDLVTIGDRLFLLREGRLVEYEDAGNVGFAAAGLRVVTANGHTLLDDVSFALEGSSFLGVVGPSGSGKSTLLGALTGYRPAPVGGVFYAGRDLYREYDALRRRIGFVPQDDLVQLDLTVAQSLGYSARLRFPPDIGAHARHERVDEVLVQLGLEHRRALRVRQLSGGQRKRVSVALELLTKPALLFLDEPTSGLDPGFERSVMQLLRDLADDGRIVVCVTHSVDSLHLCDRVLCLAPGGRPAYFGPPQLAAAHFGRDDWQQVFQDLSRPDGPDWSRRFEGTAEHQRYVEAPLSQYAPAATPVAVEPRARGRGWMRQFSALTARYARSLVADRRTLLYVAGAAPIIGLVLLLRLPPHELERLPVTQFHLFSRATIPLLGLTIGMTQLALNLSVREIVKELAIFKRERAVGLSISAYLASKVAVLAGVGLVQALIIVLIATARQGGPSEGAVFGSGRLELALVAAGVWIAGMALGLLVSSIVTSEDRVALVLPAVLGLQVLAVTGYAIDSVPQVPVLDQTAYVSSASWGFAAMGSTARLNELQAFNTAIQDLPLEEVRERPDLAIDEALALVRENDPETADRLGKAAYNHDADAWGRAMGALGLIAVGCLIGAGVALRRYDPL
jgi:ABC-type multidrug transport system ATPase subunit